MMQILLRRRDWRTRLEQLLDRIEREPHRWGSNDCALGLAAGVVEAVTGTDIAAPWRGLYGTPEEALKVLRSEGCATLEEMVAKLLPRISVGDARLGDLAYVAERESPLGGFLGVYIGERAAVLTENGKGTIVRTRATAAFMVGE